MTSILGFFIAFIRPSGAEGDVTLEAPCFSCGWGGPAESEDLTSMASELAPMPGAEEFGAPLRAPPPFTSPEAEPRPDRAATDMELHGINELAICSLEDIEKMKP